MFALLEAVLLGFLLTFLVMLAVIGVLIGVYSHALNRRNRVDPEVASPAPVLWLWKPGMAPRTHRRLQAAVSPIARIDAQEQPGADVKPTAVAKITKVIRPPTPAEPPSPTSAAGLRRTLRAQAVQMDQDLVLIARQPRALRRQSIRAIGVQVGELERLSARLVQHHRQASAPVSTAGPHPIAATPPQVLAEVSHQLDVLEQAHSEVIAIERANGLLDPDELMRQVQAPAAPAPAPAPRLAPSAAPPTPAPAPLPPSGPPTGAPVAPAPAPAGRVPARPPSGPPLPGPAPRSAPSPGPARPSPG